MNIVFSAQYRAHQPPFGSDGHILRYLHRMAESLASSLLILQFHYDRDDLMLKFHYYLFSYRHPRFHHLIHFHSHRYNLIMKEA